jgi:chromosome segregation ATPase
MLEKSKWEARNERSERELGNAEAKRKRAEAKAAKLEAELEDQECARDEHERVASVLLIDKLEAERDAKALLAGKLEAEKQAAKSKNELQAAMRELQEQMSAAKCPICFEKLEGASGKKRNRADVVLRKRGCFIPCMHASMCIKCSDESWEKFKRCPVCNTACPNKPLPIFV